MVPSNAMKPRSYIQLISAGPGLAASRPLTRAIAVNNIPGMALRE